MKFSNYLTMFRLRLRFPAVALLIGIYSALSGCAVNSPPPGVAVAVPPQWYASLPKATLTSASTNGLPHNGSLSCLSQWWHQQNDSLLVELMDAAQKVSPSVITARSNILQAQAALAVSNAALLPTLNALGGISRAKSAPQSPAAPAAIATAAQLGAQTSWEIDLFGRNQASANAGSQRLLGSQALWHEARILVAAEVASQYYSLRSCQQLLAVTSADAQSRRETSRLSELLTKAGFGAPATAALARATAAEGNSRITQQRAECDLNVKALVALTGWAEPELKQKLALPITDFPAAVFEVSSLPASVLGQRPDVYKAATDVSAASFEVGSAQAQRYPRLSISGNITGNRVGTNAATQGFTTWSIGPLALSVPLFDGGVANANVEAAKARYEDAAGRYRGVVSQAVREVEQALVNLQSTADRSGDTQIAADSYRASFAGTEARYKAGLASLVELEEARRVLLAAQSAVVLLERERRSAWIMLYKALGGGWTTASLPAPLASGGPSAVCPTGQRQPCQ